MYQKRAFNVMPNTFGGLLENMLHNGINRVNEEVSAYAVPVNMQETETAFELNLIAPGIKKENFKINVDKNTLVVSYEHKAEVKEEGSESVQPKQLRTEYNVKSFKRSFTLTDKIDTASITAKYTDGILVVSLPKKENTDAPVKEIVIN